VLNTGQIKKIKIDGKEITDFKFADKSELNQLTMRMMAEKLAKYEKILKTGGTLYTENWEEVKDEE